MQRINEYESYRALWSAVLLQTLADLRTKEFPKATDVPKIRDTGNPKENKLKLKLAYKRRDMVRKTYIANKAYARRWMDSKSRKPASFLWICDQLHIDADRLRYFSMNTAKIELLLSGKLPL